MAQLLNPELLRNLTTHFKRHGDPPTGITSATNVSNPPTDGELDAIYDVPANLPNGFIGLIDDNGSGTIGWIVSVINGAWFRGRVEPGTDPQRATFLHSSATTRGLGSNPNIYVFGGYEFSTTDANLTQASPTITLGNANVSYAMHAFIVSGGAGSVSSGQVGLRVTGTSIDDNGARTPGDSETLTNDITTLSPDDFIEGPKKWLGQITFELFVVSGAPATYSLDFNYGMVKYEDALNHNFTIVGVQAQGFAGANDSDFDVKLIHHRASGWTYAATGFDPVTATNTIASLAGDHATDDQLRNGQHFNWKRANLSTAVSGAADEGFIIEIISSANNAVEYINVLVGIVYD